MSPLHPALSDYLTIRRALGYKLARAEKLLGQFLAYLDERGEQLVTDRERGRVGDAPRRAGNPNWWALPALVRARVRHVPARARPRPRGPARRTSCRTDRGARPPTSTPTQEIVALMAATGSLRVPLRRATYRTLIGLLSVTGMRVGEAIRLDRDDVDLAHGVLRVRDTKFGKSRELPVHASTVDALRDYLRLRDRACPEPRIDAVLISPAGTRLLYCGVQLDVPPARRARWAETTLGALPTDAAQSAPQLRGAHAAGLVSRRARGAAADAAAEHLSRARASQGFTIGIWTPRRSCSSSPLTVSSAHRGGQP